MTIDFTNLSLYANNYAWTFGNGETQNTSSNATVTSTYTIPGIYTIELIASNGICFDVYTLEIEVIPPMVVTPPNVFTPNGDNSNDLYFVDVKFGEHFEAIILNRWGNLMAELNSLNQGWDGKTNGTMVEEGVYFIKYKATDYSEKTIEGQTYFHLIR
jgi:gliding motility-associated-like protein